MSFEIAQAFVTVRPQVDSQAMDSAAGEIAGGLEGTMSSVGGSMSDFGSKMTRRVTAPIVGVAAAIGGLAMNAAKAGDEIGKGAAKLGVTTDAYQEMDYWASQNGISHSSMERAVGRLNQRIGRAIDGNEKYAEAFEKIDVALKDSQGNLRSTEDVMGETIVKLSEIEDAQLQSAMASEIFGTKLARDLMPALRDGAMTMDEAAAKAHELGIVMDADAVAAAEEFQDMWDNVTRQLKAVAVEIGSALMPAIQEFVPVITDYVVPVIKVFANALIFLIDLFNMLPKPVKGLIGALAGIAAAVGPVALVVGKMMTAFAPLAPYIVKLMPLAAGLGKALLALVPIMKVVGAALLGPWGLVIAAVVGLVTVIVKNWDTIKSATKAAWDWIKNASSTAWNAVRDTIANIVANTVGWVIRKFTEVTDFVRSIPGKITSALSRVYQAITDPFRRAINWVIDKLNSLIRMWNNISFELPSVSLPGGGEFGGQRVGVPQVNELPRAAFGGSVRSGGMVTVGERGPEQLMLPKGADVLPQTDGLDVSAIVQGLQAVQSEVQANQGAIHQTDPTGGLGQLAMLIASMAGDIRGIRSQGQMFMGRPLAAGFDPSIMMNPKEFMGRPGRVNPDGSYRPGTPGTVHSGGPGSSFAAAVQRGYTPQAGPRGFHGNWVDSGSPSR